MLLFLTTTVELCDGGTSTWECFTSRRDFRTVGTPSSCSWCTPKNEPSYRSLEEPRLGEWNSGLFTGVQAGQKIINVSGCLPVECRTWVLCRGREDGIRIDLGTDACRVTWTFPGVRHASGPPATCLISPHSCTRISCHVTSWRILFAWLGTRFHWSTVARSRDGFQQRTLR